MNNESFDNNSGAGGGNCGLFSLSSCKFALLGSLIGLILLDNLDLDQQNSLGNFILSIGQSMLTAAAQGEVVQKQQQAEIRRQIQSLKKQITMLEEELNL